MKLVEFNSHMTGFPSNLASGIGGLESEVLFMSSGTLGIRQEAVLAGALPINGYP